VLRSPFLSALRHRDFRLFIFGQFVSLCGTWIQTVAQGWLVLQLTDSAFKVGLVTTLGTLPILLFTLYGGVVADRVDKRRTVLLLQCGMVLEALALGILTYLGWITVEWVMGLAVFFGLLSAFEVPTRQSLIAEIVDREDLLNAISLNSAMFNLARLVGPAVAGFIVAGLGEGACFLERARAENDLASCCKFEARHGLPVLVRGKEVRIACPDSRLGHHIGNSLFPGLVMVCFPVFGLVLDLTVRFIEDKMRRILRLLENIEPEDTRFLDAAACVFKRERSK